MTTELDRNKQKIASFRINEGDWADFTAHAQKNGFTATDILKSAMAQYITGSFDPVSTTVSTVRLDDRIQEIVDTALAPLQKEIDSFAVLSDRLEGLLSPIQEWIAHSDTPKQQAESIEQLVNTAVSTAFDRLDLDRLIATAVSTSVNTAVDADIQQPPEISKSSLPHLGAKTKTTKPLVTSQPIPENLDMTSGLSHPELAKLLNKTPSALSRWATGNRKIPLSVSEKWVFVEGKWYSK